MNCILPRGDWKKENIILNNRDIGQVSGISPTRPPNHSWTTGPLLHNGQRMWPYAMLLAVVPDPPRQTPFATFPKGRQGWRKLAGAPYAHVHGGIFRGLAPQPTPLQEICQAVPDLGSLAVCAFQQAGHPVTLVWESCGKGCWADLIGPSQTARTATAHQSQKQSSQHPPDVPTHYCSASSSK